MKTILIIGAAGYLGSNIVKALAGNMENHIIAADISKNNIPSGDNVTGYSNDELFNLSSLAVDTIINCAFARGNAVSALVTALDFNEKLILGLKNIRFNTLLNISSQGIYKPSQVPNLLSSENSPIEPFDKYALAKYAQEKLFTTSFPEKTTNIRMASLCANAGFLVHFVDCVIKGNEITVTAPNQFVSIIDVTDAVTGILAISKLPENIRKPVYNLGTGKQYSILQIAETVNRIGKDYGYNQVNISVVDEDKCIAVGMDPTLLEEDTGWKPLKDISTMVCDVFAKRRCEES